MPKTLTDENLKYLKELVMQESYAFDAVFELVMDKPELKPIENAVWEAHKIHELIGAELGILE